MFPYTDVHFLVLGIVNVVNMAPVWGPGTRPNPVGPGSEIQKLRLEQRRRPPPKRRESMVINPPNYFDTWDEENLKYIQKYYTGCRRVRDVSNSFGDTEPDIVEPTVPYIDNGPRIDSEEHDSLCLYEEGVRKVTCNPLFQDSSNYEEDPYYVSECLPVFDEQGNTDDTYDSINNLSDHSSRTRLRPRPSDIVLRRASTSSRSSNNRAVSRQNSNLRLENKYSLDEDVFMSDRKMSSASSSSRSRERTTTLPRSRRCSKSVGSSSRCRETSSPREDEISTGSSSRTREDMDSSRSDEVSMKHSSSDVRSMEQEESSGSSEQELGSRSETNRENSSGKLYSFLDDIF